MNKYLVAICDIQAGTNNLKMFIAKSYNDCLDKIMNYVTDQYNFDECSEYSEFVSMADDNDILISNIIDVEAI